MSKRKLRTDKDCLNCGTFVAERYCPKCGQENIEIRPSFRKLFTQFLIDFVNYDDGFLRTFKMVLFKPGQTIKEFLEGKRQRNFPPAKMVVFVSFFAFLIPYILPDFQKEKSGFIVVNKEESENKEFTGFTIDGISHVNTLEQLDKIREEQTGKGKMDSLDYAFYKSVILLPEKYDSLNYIYRSQTSKVGFSFNNGVGGLSAVVNENGFTFNKDYKDIKTVEEFDAIDKSLDKSTRIPFVFKLFIRKEIELHERGMSFFSDNYNELIEKEFASNSSKVTFLYMPLFALLLTLFHSRKKWKLYDHGIFTLYYFSFLLIGYTLLTVLKFFISLPLLISSNTEGFVSTILSIVMIFTFMYVIFYFYRAHQVVYNERKIISRLKSTVLLFLNITFIILLTLIYSVWTLLIV